MENNNIGGKHSSINEISLVKGDVEELYELCFQISSCHFMVKKGGRSKKEIKDIERSSAVQFTILSKCFESERLPKENSITFFKLLFGVEPLKRSLIKVDALNYCKSDKDGLEI